MRLPISRDVYHMLCHLFPDREINSGLSNHPEYTTEWYLGGKALLGVHTQFNEDNLIESETYWLEEKED